jgi:hypothetical protein
MPHFLTGGLFQAIGYACMRPKEICTDDQRRRGPPVRMAVVQRTPHGGPWPRLETPRTCAALRMRAWDPACAGCWESLICMPEKRIRTGDLGSDVSCHDGGLCVYPKGASGDTPPAHGQSGDCVQGSGIALRVFEGPARRRHRCKTTDAQEGDQRLGTGTLPGGERHGDHLASRCQVKTLKFPSSRSSTSPSTSSAALDSSAPRGGTTRAGNGANGRGGAAADSGNAL